MGVRRDLSDIETREQEQELGEYGAEEDIGPRRNEIAVDWKKLHKQKFHDFYPSPNITRVIKLRIMRWAVHVVRTEERRVLTGFR